MNEDYLYKLWLALYRDDITERTALMALLEHLALGTVDEELVSDE